MSKQKPPVTPAVRQLRQAEVSFSDHLYGYVEKGGTVLQPILIKVGI
jgi:hypothetical protein